MSNLSQLQTAETQSELIENLLISPRAARLRSVAVTIVMEYFDHRSTNIVNKSLSLENKNYPQKISDVSRQQIEEVISTHLINKEAASVKNTFPSLSTIVFIPIFRLELMEILKEDIKISDEELYSTIVYPLAMRLLKKAL